MYTTIFIFDLGKRLCLVYNVSKQSTSVLMYTILREDCLFCSDNVMVDLFFTFYYNEA